MESVFADLLLPGALSIATFLVYSSRASWAFKAVALVVMAAIEAKYAAPDNKVYGLLCILVSHHLGFVFYQLFIHVPKGRKGSRFRGLVKSIRSFRSEPDEPVVKPSLTVSPVEARQARSPPQRSPPKRPTPHRPTPHPEVPPAFMNDGPEAMPISEFEQEMQPDDETAQAIDQVLYGKMLVSKTPIDPRKSRGPSIIKSGQ